MPTYKVILQAPITAKRLGKVLEVSGMILTEGTFTDKTGKTVFYPAKVIKEAADSFLGVPLIYPHSTEFEDVQKVGGFSTLVNSVSNSLFYSGIVYKPVMMDKIKTGELNAHSIEATLISHFDKEKGVEVADKLVGESIAFTDHPACESCKVYSHSIVTNVKLEKGGKMEMAEEIPIEPEEPEEGTSAKHQKYPEITGYPMPKTKPWGEMTDAEKLQSCVLFYKHQKYPYPYPKPVKKELEEVDMSKYTDFIKECTAGGKKTMEECAKEWKAKQTKWEFEFPEDFPEDKKVAYKELLDEYAKALEELATLKSAFILQEKKAVTAIVSTIKQTDAEFDEKAFLEGIECPVEQRKLLEKYNIQLERLKPTKIKVKGVDKAGEDKVGKVCLDSFGAETPEELLYSIVPEAKKEEK